MRSVIGSRHVSRYVWVAILVIAFVALSEIALLVSPTLQPVRTGGGGPVFPQPAPTTQVLAFRA
jgi:hypothetical protein